MYIIIRIALVEHDLYKGGWALGSNFFELNIDTLTRV